MRCFDTTFIVSVSASFPKCRLVASLPRIRHGLMVQVGYLPRYGFYDIYQPRDYVARSINPIATFSSVNTYTCITLCTVLATLVVHVHNTLLLYLNNYKHSYLIQDSCINCPMESIVVSDLLGIDPGKRLH